MKKRTIIFFLVLVSVVNTSLISGKADVENEPFFTLILKTSGGGVKPDYGLYIANNLREIGINVEVKVQGWYFWPPIYPIYPPNIGDWDLFIFNYYFSPFERALMALYSEEGLINFSSLGNDLPYCMESEDLLVRINEEADFEARQNITYEWQQLLMEKICPVIPLFSQRIYTGVWANTLGYDEEWGIINSLPYMNYEGYHEGQTNLNELNVADANWRDLNPIFSDDFSSSYICELLTEPIIQFSPDYHPMKTGLVEDWDIINNTHYKFYVRDNIFWTPSFNITGRTASSPELDVASTPLMVGLKGDLSNGINQQLSAKDFVFTILAHSSLISEGKMNYDWVKNIYVDPSNELVFHIEVDANSTTEAIEPYAHVLSELAISCLPEFFLNSTDPSTYFTKSGIPYSGLFPEIVESPQWQTFSYSAFGTGKFMLDYFVKNFVTVLQRNPYWFGVGAKGGQTGLVPFVDTVNIRVIPDISAELAEFLAGELDCTGLSMFPSTRKEMQSDTRFIVNTKISNIIELCSINLRRPYLGGEDNFIWANQTFDESYTKALAVRKAISYAIDRNAMNVMEQINLHHPFPDTYYSMQYENITRYDYNLEKAWEWMNKAGYTWDTHTTLDLDFELIAVIVLCLIPIVSNRIKRRRKRELTLL